jgi:DNA-binding transcriptional LysR family regulator
MRPDVGMWCDARMRSTGLGMTEWTDRRPGTGHPERWGGSDGANRIELRQLHYFVTVAEELHFGRAATREHIAPSALSQQMQRLERALGVLLIKRTTRHVELTAAGERFLIEVRQILDHLHRATVLAQGVASSAPVLRVGVLDEGYEAARPILREIQSRVPELEIHQLQVGVPEQCRLLADGRLDVGIGRAPGASPHLASEVFRLDPLGVLVPDDHRFARLAAVNVSALHGETLLLADEQQSPELNQFVVEVCRVAGFFPALHHGSVQNLRAAVDIINQRQCLLCIPASAAGVAAGLRWRPLVPSVPRYPWSVIWRARSPSAQVLGLVAITRELSRRFGWRDAPGEIAS